MTLQAALNYAATGYPVFPCRPDKRPHTEHGFKDATTDPSVIEQWWQRWPNAFIGMPTGAVSGLAVLDLDMKNGKNGFSSVPDWESRSPVIARTQSGGAHIYFKAEGAPHCTSDDIALGVDTRGDGGYVVVPPSPGYTWVNGSDFSELPAWPDDMRPKAKTRNQTKPDAPTADDSLLAAAVKAMQNHDLGWDEWNRTGMALWRATDGSDVGKALWHTYSEKSKKYDADETEARWEHYTTSPPNQIGAGTLYYMADQDSPGWRSAYLKEHFECNDKGKPISISQRNVTTALALLGVSLRRDVFSDRETIVGLPGFDLLDDAAIERLWLLIEERFRFLPTKDFFWTVVSDAARRNAYHPVRDYLSGLKWDGTPRLDQWLISYADAKDTKYVRAVSSITLIAAVRRVRQPGCKFDEMLILESEQGKEKSVALEVLAVNPEWFSDDLPLNADGKRVIEQTRGRWIIEAAELSGMRKTGVDHLKAMLSRQADRARLAFGRKTSEKRREFIVVGTINDERYLKDLTGNRRFWPVAVKFDIAKLKRDRDQLWAEAAAREAQGDSIRLDPQLWEDAAEEQTERTVEEPWIDIIKNLLGDREGKLLAADAWTLVNLTAGQQTQEHNNRMGSAMRKLGWARGKLRFGGQPHNCYHRGDSSSKVLKRIKVLRHPDGVWIGEEDEEPPF